MEHTKEDKIVLREDYPDVLGEWMWESEYLEWKKFNDEQREVFRDFIYKHNDEPIERGKGSNK